MCEKSFSPFLRVHDNSDEFLEKEKKRERQRVGCKRLRHLKSDLRLDLT